MAKRAGKQDYGNESISALKGADRVRKRPGVIFGSDGLEGCEHSFFEILSNSVDEAREGHGNVITVTAYRDYSIKVDDRGRGVPLGYNEKEQRWNWDLIYCELYAGGKYENNKGGGAYEYSLGLNGLGACATQYSSEFMHVSSYDGQQVHTISFAKGNGNCKIAVPDLRDPRERDAYRNDNACTTPSVAGDQLLPCTSLGEPDIPDETYEYVRNLWLEKKNAEHV